MLEKKIDHDKLIEKLFIEYEKSKKSHYISLFLSSLSSKNLGWRSGLSVFAIMQTFPKHSFTLRDDSTINSSSFDETNDQVKHILMHQSPCLYCSSFKEKKVDTELTKECFHQLGGLASYDILDYYFYLSESNKLDKAKPTNEDFRIFSEILNILSAVKEEDTLKKVTLSRIGKIKGFKSNTEQRQALLETLGYCSILETESHKGSLTKYVSPSSTPRKTHSSDWRYPVDFWTGKDGINKDALKFWFEEYQELEALWK